MGHIHRHDPGSKLTIFLCLAMLLCISPMPAAAADGDGGQKLSEIATFGHIGLHYAGENRQAGAEIQDNTLIEKGTPEDTGKEKEEKEMPEQEKQAEETENREENYETAGIDGQPYRD